MVCISMATITTAQIMLNLDRLTSVGKSGLKRMRATFAAANCAKPWLNLVSLAPTQWAEKITFSNPSLLTPCRKAGGFSFFLPRYPTWVITLLSTAAPGASRRVELGLENFFIKGLDKRDLINYIYSIETTNNEV